MRAGRLAPLRILMLTRALPAHQLGGMEQHGIVVCRGLAARGHCVEAWTTGRQDGVTEEEDGEVRVRYFAGAPPGVHSPEFTRAVSQELQEHGSSFDLIIQQSSSAAGALHGLGPPVVTFIHGTNVSEILSIMTCDRGKGRLFRVLFRFAPLLARSVILDHQWRQTERFLCVGDYLAEQFATLYLVPRERIGVVRPGVPLPPTQTAEGRREAKHRLAMRPDDVVLLCVGRLAPDKAFDNAIRAFSACRDLAPCKLVIVGSGPSEADLRALANSLGPTSSVAFVGHLPYAELGAYYSAADVLLIPSIRYEGLPGVLVEGAAAGLAVIASNRAGLAAELAGTDAALLVRPGSLPELTDAIAALLANQRLRDALSANIRRLAEQRYSLNTMLDGIEAAMSEVVS